MVFDFKRVCFIEQMVESFSLPVDFRLIVFEGRVLSTEMKLEILDELVRWHDDTFHRLPVSSVQRASCLSHRETA